jgi:hypothetical protein
MYARLLQRVQKLRGYNTCNYGNNRFRIFTGNKGPNNCIQVV